MRIPNCPAAVSSFMPASKKPLPILTGRRLKAEQSQKTCLMIHTQPLGVRGKGLEIIIFFTKHSSPIGVKMLGLLSDDKIVRVLLYKLFFKMSGA